MKTLATEITIRADAGRIWSVLTDFAQYPQWNPFVRSVDGVLQQGRKLRVQLQPSGAKAMTFTPTVLDVQPERSFCWRGRLLLPGLFDGEHSFRIEPVGEGICRFLHGENFSGILVPLLWKSLDTTTRQGFEAMNAALKERAEQPA